ncbi:MAG: M48 family metalloprotease [Victivallales bacterium]
MWQAIHQNKIKSVFLIVFMGILLVVLGAAIGGSVTGNQDGILGGVFLAGLAWFFLTVLAVLEGKNILLSLSGAREVSHDDAPQLYNIVEEMRIAAALPATPKVFIVESRAPNAFAVGTPANAAVAVTTGLLSVLSRDELQGVIAHEIGHVKNQDSRFMTLAGIMLGVIVVLADVYTRSMFYGGMGNRRSDSSSKDSGGLQMILFVIAIVLAILAPILANLLYFACSRSREYLADASSAIFTRYPEGLASALEKISRSSIPLESATRVTAPMYIINPLNKACGNEVFSLFSTHPPTEERIKILRTMASGAGLGEYNKAYASLKGGNIASGSDLRSAEELELRGIKRAQPELDRKQQTRDANDILLRANKFRFINCACGLRIKVPPMFAAKSVTCPRCGAQHQL